MTNKFLRCGIITFQIYSIVFIIRTQKNVVFEHIDDTLHKTAISISASGVSCILKETKLGKSAKLDSLAAEHFVYSHNSVAVHLCLLFTFMLKHGYIRQIL